MASAIVGPVTAEDEIVRKRPWAEPMVTTLDLGDAEASDGPGPDGGLAS